MKRSIDIILALFGLVTLLPVICLFAFIIRIDSPGSPLFVQTRVGRYGKLFKCMKLRTMRIDTGDRPSHEVGSASITRAGTWMRRFKFDEIPQLYNVVKGEMSLVGPRPCLPQQTELIDQRTKRGVMTLRPGITGWAQVRGIDMSDPILLAATDAIYIEKQSLKVDIGLVLATVMGTGRGNDVAQMKPPKSPSSSDWK